MVLRMRTKALASWMSASVPRAADAINSRGVLIFARYASEDQNSGERNIVRNTSRISPFFFINVSLMRLTRAGGGLSETNRLANLLEMCLAVAGFLARRC